MAVTRGDGGFASTAQIPCGQKPDGDKRNESKQPGQSEVIKDPDQ